MVLTSHLFHKKAVSLHAIIVDVLLMCITKPKKYIQYMKRKDYERPTLRVVKLPQHSQLLTSSPFGKLPDEETPDQQDWD